MKRGWPFSQLASFSIRLPLFLRWSGFQQAQSEQDGARAGKRSLCSSACDLSPPSVRPHRVICCGKTALTGSPVSLQGEPHRQQQ